MDEIQVSVSIGTKFGDFSASMKVPDVLVEAWKSIGTIDEEISALAIATKEMPVNSPELERVVKLREGVAKDIADLITKHLVASMKARDTHNGYGRV